MPVAPPASMPPSPPRHKATAEGNLRGGGWMALSVVAASAMTLGVREASASVDTGAIVFLRSLGGLALALVWLAVAPGVWRGLHFSNPGLHVLRGSLVGLSTLMGFYTISQIPLATATVLFFTAPIFATALAVFNQGERPGPRRLAAIAAGFAGVVVVVQPGAAPFTWALAAALGSSFLFAVVLNMTRRMANRDGAFATYLSSAALAALVSAPFAFMAEGGGPGAWVAVGPLAAAALAVVIVGSLVRSLADIQAYRFAEASFLAPLAYTRLILLAAAGYALYAETPDAPTLAGGAMIVAAALYIARRERARAAQKR